MFYTCNGKSSGQHMTHEKNGLFQHTALPAYIIGLYSCTVPRHLIDADKHQDSLS